jgi:hypothetical protein
MKKEYTSLHCLCKSLKPRQQINAFRGLSATSFGFVLEHTQGFSTTKEIAQKEWGQWDCDTVPHLAQFAPYFLQIRANSYFRFMLRVYLDVLQAAGVENETT